MRARTGALSTLEADRIFGTDMAAFAKFRTGLRTTATGHTELVLAADRVVVTNMRVRAGTLSTLEADRTFRADMPTFAKFRTGFRATATGHTQLILVADRIVVADMSIHTRATIALEADCVFRANVVSCFGFILAELCTNLRTGTVGHADCALLAKGPTTAINDTVLDASPIAGTFASGKADLAALALFGPKWGTGPIVQANGSGLAEQSTSAIENIVWHTPAIAGAFVTGKTNLTALALHRTARRALSTLEAKLSFRASAATGAIVQIGVSRVGTSTISGA